MSVSKWAYLPERCDGDICVGDCDLCSKAMDNVAMMEEDMKNAEIIKRLEAIETCELVLDEQEIGKITKQAFEAIQETARLAIAALERDKLEEDNDNG